MRKFSDVLEEYLDQRDSRNNQNFCDSSYYYRNSILGEIEELQEELDSYFKEKPCYHK